MHQTIHEQIWVAGIFKHSQFKPVWFMWQGRRFKIDQITLVSNIKEGAIKKIIYSVCSKDNLYRLDFFPFTQDWYLESVWIES